jgi:hypothetical protein
MFAQRHKAGELPADDFAKLTDRVLLAAGKQRPYRSDNVPIDHFPGHTPHHMDMPRHTQPLRTPRCARSECAWQGWTFSTRSVQRIPAAGRRDRPVAEISLFEMPATKLTRRYGRT